MRVRRVRLTTKLSHCRPTASVAGTENMNEPKIIESETRGGSCAPAHGSVTVLKCDHIGLGMNAIMVMPAVAIMCGVSVAWPPAQFLAGFALGVWLSMWLVVIWAWLTRRQSPNARTERRGTTTLENQKPL